MSDMKHPELHVNEEPRSDFIDTGVGFGVMFGFMLVVSVIATVASVLMK